MATPAHQYPNSPQVIQAAGSEGLFTSLQLYADVPQIRRKLYQKYGFKKTEFLKLKELGLKRTVSGPVYGHWEEDDILGTIVVGAVTTASTGPNTPVVFSLKSESMLTKTIDGATVRFSLVQEQDQLEIPGTRKKILVTNVDRGVNPHRVTVVPLDPSLDLDDYVVPNVRFYIGTNAFAEGSGPAKSIMPTQTKWENHTQISKTNYTETGSSLTNELPWHTPEGAKFKLLKYGHLVEKLQYHKVSLGWLTGEKSANVTQANIPGLNYNPVVKTTQGFIDYAQSEGTNITHTYGGIDLEHFDSIAEVVRRNKMGTDSVLSKMGYNYRAELENVLLDFFDRDSLKYLSGKFKPELFGGTDPEDYFAWIGFSGIKKNGLKFVFDTVEEFDDVNGLGAEGYDYRHLGIHLPWGTVKNKGDNAMIPSIGYVSKKLGNYDRDMNWVWTGSANLANPTDPQDVLRLDLLSDYGFEGILGSQWVFDELSA